MSDDLLTNRKHLYEISVVVFCAQLLIGHNKVHLKGGAFSLDISIYYIWPNYPQLIIGLFAECHHFWKYISVDPEQTKCSCQSTSLLTFHYVNVSVLIKFLQKTSVFTLIIIKFSIKSYVLDVY